MGSDRSSQSDIRKTNVPRRRFLQATGAAALSAGVWSEVAARESISPNEKLKILCVGTANRAAANIEALKNQDIVALCDLDSDYLEVASKKFPAAKRYSDYREMIDKEAGTADAILVSTADHHHAPAALRAIRSGLHCYCEKPLAHTIEECRVLAQAAKEKDVVTQMGTQIHAESNYRRVVEIIQSGAIGEVNEVHVWVGKVWGGEPAPTGEDPAPKNLNWDLWLGPAPNRPYVAGAYHPAKWRRWWDFGQGTLGDMGCHFIDLPFWALGLRHPVSCQAEGPPADPVGCPGGLIVKYKFPKTDSSPAVDLTWYDGNKTPRVVSGQRVKGSGVMFVGTEGKMFANYTSYKLFPEEKFSQFQPPAQTIPNSIGHHAEWVKACKNGSATTCNFDYSGALSETVLLGNVAYRVGKEIQWDAKNLKATNCPEADPFIRKEYRAGWELT